MQRGEGPRTEAWAGSEEGALFLLLAHDDVPLRQRTPQLLPSLLQREKQKLFEVVASVVIAIRTQPGVQQ